MTALTADRFQPLTSAQFGDFGRYNLIVGVTRFGKVTFMVNDAAVLSPVHGMAETIRQADSLSEALAGLSEADGAFSDAPQKGDWVVNLDSVPAICMGVGREPGDVALKCPATGQRWDAPAQNVRAIR